MGGQGHGSYESDTLVWLESTTMSPAKTIFYFTGGIFSRVVFWPVWRVIDDLHNSDKTFDGCLSDL